MFVWQATEWSRIYYKIGRESYDHDNYAQKDHDEICDDIPTDKMLIDHHQQIQSVSCEVDGVGNEGDIKQCTDCWLG